LKKDFGLGSISFLDVFSIDLNDGGEAVNDELFEKGAVRNGVSMRLDVEDLEIGQILKLSDLEQGHDVALLKLQDLKLPE
jgi:hypothetical protein